jgi:A/G-specific adenine glycosylase
MVLSSPRWCINLKVIVPYDGRENRFSLKHGRSYFMTKKELFVSRRDGEHTASALLNWYDRVRRPFPWRETTDPYKIWISEVMLQQTQTSRAADYYLRWTCLFPTAEALARAPEEDVLKAWEGLGYYGRARNLRAAAKVIADTLGGRLPESYEGLLALPGVGPYTAGAVASIAFGLPVPAVDANGKRVFSRLLDLDCPVDRSAGEGAVREAFDRLLSPDRPGDFNQAVMELGATLCLPRSPQCGECPLSGICRARERGTALLRPVFSGREKGEAAEGRMIVLLRDGNVYLRKRPSRGLWAGFEEFPWEAPPAEPPLPPALSQTEGTDFGLIRCSFTRWRVTLRVAVVSAPDGLEQNTPGGRWAGGDELTSLTLPAGSARVRKMLFRAGLIACRSRSPKDGAE